MSTPTQRPQDNAIKVLVTTVAILAAIFVIAALAIPNLLAARKSSDESSRWGRMRSQRTEMLAKAGLNDDAKPAPGDESFRAAVRVGTLDCRIDDPLSALAKADQIVRTLGGSIESDTITTGESEYHSAEIVVRVPADHFDDAMKELATVGVLRNQSVQVEDVTKQYVDRDATLRNLHAEEAQYLAIMKRAGTIRDTLDVANRLSDVRGEIERSQAEMNSLRNRVQMATITLSLHTEPGVAVPTVQWLRRGELRAAFVAGVNSLSGYVAAMLSLLFYLPVILLWSLTIFFGFVYSWRLLRWLWIRFLHRPSSLAPPVPAEAQS